MTKWNKIYVMCFVIFETYLENSTNYENIKYALIKIIYLYFLSWIFSKIMNIIDSFYF